MTQHDSPADPALHQAKLFEQLREASWVHQNPSELLGRTRWTGAIKACQAVARFILDTGWSPELAAPLMEMTEGFKDLELGTIPPIFSLNPEPLKRDRSSQRKFHQAWAAAILEIAIESGEGEKSAAERIARFVCRWHAFKNQKVTGTTIVNWRKTVKGGSSEERRPFEGICKGLRSEPDRGRGMIKNVLAAGPPGMPKS